MLRSASKYQLKIFGMAMSVIWALILFFTIFIYVQERDLRQQSIIDRIDLATLNVISTQMRGGDMQRQLDAIAQYFDASSLEDLSIQVYDTRTQKLLCSIGKVRDYIPEESLYMRRELQADSSLGVRMFDITDHEGDPLYFYSSELSPNGEIDVRCYLPDSRPITKDISIPLYVWIFVLGMGLAGSIGAWFVTAHMASNIKLLSNFAKRAADDYDFIPLGDFPNDEIGDISRQIVAIYNQRMQANVRREREHVIAIKAIEEQNRMKLVLTNNIGHELKTPIGIMTAYVDTMMQTPDMPEEDRKHFLDRIADNLQRITNMLNSLSTMTRLSESGNRIEITTLNFHNIVFNMAKEFEVADILEGMHFRYSIPYDCEVLGNDAIINSALANLVKNAVYYSQGTEIGIDLISRAPDYFTFSFYDNGVGVEDDKLQYLFERFYRVDKGRSRKNGGTGLGLSIVKTALNTMGGSISVRNRREGGLEFVFTLLRPTAKNKEKMQNRDSQTDVNADAPRTDAPTAPSADSAPAEA